MPSSMKSMIVHGLDEDIIRELEKQARANGISPSELVRHLLANGLGLTRSLDDMHYDEIAPGLSAWSQDEFQDLCGRVVTSGSLPAMAVESDE